MATIDITKENFRSQIPDSGIALIDFWAEWCMPCNRFTPIYESAAQRHPDVVFGKVNTDEQQELAAGFKIRSIPSLVVFRDGVIMYEKAGILNGRQLDALIENVKNTDMQAVQNTISTTLSHNQ
ncbi:thioredoxin family protein [Timonella sp. A28]|uniref:thioredoxin family protein n=1 Tax=Timonella sp. A28 TaxID=3442640 RepID=UPI003EC11D36